MKKILLIGLPNIGKSTIFNRLISDKVRISAYPGSAVEVRRGDLKIDGEEFEIIDTPGVCNLFLNEDNERVARNIIIDEKPDLLVHVCDAKNLNHYVCLIHTLFSLLYRLFL